MRIFSTLIALAALVVSLQRTGRHGTDDPDCCRTGYTRGSETGAYPQYPDLQIQVEVPPEH